jgi:hypothetical protein
MKTKLFFLSALFCFCFFHLVNAQKMEIDTTGDDYYLCASSGYYFIPIASINSQLSKLGQLSTPGIKQGFTNPVGVGFDFVHKSKSRITIAGLFSYNYLFPQHMHITNNSWKFTLKGYNLQLDLVSFDWVKSDKITLTGGLACVYGRLMLIQDSRCETVSTNSYIGPEVRIEFNYRLGDQYYIGVRSAYRYDVSSTDWKISYPNFLAGCGSTGISLGGTHLSGIMIGLCIAMEID